MTRMINDKFDKRQDKCPDGGCVSISYTEYMGNCVFVLFKKSMVANNYICDLDGRMLLWAGGLLSGPLELAVSSLVAVSPSDGVASTTPTLSWYWAGYCD